MDMGDELASFALEYMECTHNMAVALEHTMFLLLLFPQPQASAFVS